MSKKIKIMIGVIMAIVVIGIVWWMIKNSQNTSQSNINGTAATANESSTENTIVSIGTSDNDLDQDMNNISAQLNGLSSDTANVDASMASSSQSGQ